ncbi:aldose 1-epimerase [Paenibacillus sp. IB182496]|uniref:Aldose 1-epimerase n=1 Tax=Paenibacillus sabuli TaxID=2772509 RepID=A0A927BUJ7_9BACL|nr:aldose 1-epimerase [Paenibacillus sabuli]MBD2845648.1 aldose 1-epimerase [Paenibacillus sabuli]
MSTTIEHITYMEEAALRVRTPLLEGIIVPAWGTNLISLIWRESGTPLLRTPASREAYLAKPVLHGTPVLFPPNRIDGGTFDFNGRTYTFPVNEKDKGNHIHGVLVDAPWTIAHTAADEGAAVVETAVRAKDVPAVFAALPHDFTARMRFVFEQGRVTQTFTVDNDDEAPMPWGLGYHTTFHFPLTAGGDLSHCTFQLQTDQIWELGERLLPTGRLLPAPRREELEQGLSLQGIALDDVFQSRDQGDNEAVLTDEQAGLRIVYRADSQFGQWVVYNAGGESGFLCPEPYTWVTNAPNVKAPAELTGLRAVAPGQRAVAVTQISVSAR